jgi:hypothetical protein
MIALPAFAPEGKVHVKIGAGATLEVIPAGCN